MSSKGKRRGGGKGRDIRGRIDRIEAALAPDGPVVIALLDTPETRALLAQGLLPGKRDGSGEPRQRLPHEMPILLSASELAL